MESDDYTTFIQAFCETQGDNYKVVCRYDNSEIAIIGGSMDIDEWEDVGIDLIDLLSKTRQRFYYISTVSKNGFILQEA